MANFEIKKRLQYLFAYVRERYYYKACMIFENKVIETTKIFNIKNLLMKTLSPHPERLQYFFPMWLGKRTSTGDSYPGDW